MQPADAASRMSGILLMLAAVGVFSVMDALMKQLSGHYPALQVASLRGASSLPFVLLPFLWRGQWQRLRPVNIRLHLLRGALAILMLWAFIWALARASMADTYAVFMSAPLLVVIVAAISLGERIGRHRWIAIIAGFAGTLIVLRPAAASLVTVAGLATLGAALAYAAVVVTVRLLARTDSTPAMVFWFLLIVALGAGALAWPDWVAINPADWPWIAAIGLSGWAGQHLITEAFRRAPAATVAPFEYTAMLWAIGIDMVAWQALPGATMLAGSGLIIAAGLYLLWVEHHRSGALPVATGSIPEKIP